MAGTIELDELVRGLENGLGSFCPGERRTGAGLRSQIPLIYQILDPAKFYMAFEPGGQAYQVLANDQNRFSPPRSLPPILDLELPDDVDNPTDAYVIARYAYSEGAFLLLEDLLARGHVFGMNGFLEFGWSLAKALAFLHEHGIVHGQWNAKSVVAVPTEELAHPLLDASNHRFEVINTGVCFEDASSIPREYLDRGYYPPEVFLSEAGLPDYAGLDLLGDVYCFAAFLKDLMQRACSSEELPSQAHRILEELQREANRRGWKASPESLRRKEMEILDHLYTIRVRSETLIQEALRSRDERCNAAQLLELVEDLHAKATSYREELFARGFEPVNAFGEALQHYTTFQLQVSPTEINSCEDSTVVLTGVGLPHELVRVTLNETHQGIRVVSAQPGQIEFVVEHGFRSGEYRVSVNNRRTNGTLEVFSPVWKLVEPPEIHQPWEGFGNIQLCVRGERLPKDAEFHLQSVGDGKERVAAVVVLPDELEEGTDDALRLTFPCDTAPGEYELLANGLPMDLKARVLEQLPDPVLREEGLSPNRIKNHCSWNLRLTGRNFHPKMAVDFGEDTPEGLRLSVTSPSEAELQVPSEFPPGDYRVWLNFRVTEVRLQVIEPRWIGMDPPAVKLMREHKAPIPLQITGEFLPSPSEEGGYLLYGRGEEALACDLTTEEVEPDRTHRLEVGPDLPRGVCGVRFGERDTGLRLRVRRQLPRSALAAMGLLGLLLLGGTGFALHRTFAPRITGVEPATVYAFGEPTVLLRGKHLAAVEFLDLEGQVVSEFPVRELEEPDTFEFVPRHTSPGRFRLRPLGPLYGSAASEHDLTLLSPGFRLEPATVHRLQDNEVRISGQDGFDITSISSLQLHGSESGELLESLPVDGGLVEIPRDTLREGDYVVAIDGLRTAGEELRFKVVGPAVADVTPNPVSRDAEGWLQVSVAGAYLEPIPALQDVVGASETHSLEPVGDGEYRSTAPPGRYRLVVAPEGMEPQPVSDLVLTVLPTPVVAQVSPGKLEPETDTEVTVTGTNLAALERLVLQPLDGGLTVEIPIDAVGIEVGEALESSYEFHVSLQPGTWRVLPAEDVVTLEVFADCREALDGFVTSGDPDELLRCLDQGRPPADVVRDAADLFFDRGMFEQARELYLGTQDRVGRFRLHFIDSFLNGRGVPMVVPIPEAQRTPYDVAALRLGWSGARSAEFSPGPLPWELEFVRGLTGTDPEAAVAAFRRSIEQKTLASRGFEIEEFEPALRGIAQAQLEFAVQLLGRVEIPRARSLLQRQLVENPEAWNRLGVDQRSLALFWSGHIELWYDGDKAAAISLFERASELNGASASWSRDYLSALVGGSTDQVNAVEPGWESTFVRVYRLFEEATKSPNYNLLAMSGDTGSFLSGEEREKSAELRDLLATLEQLQPADPFANHVLLHSLRSAQRVSWPAQAGSRLADEYRARLEGLVVPPELEPLRQYYIVEGELEPYDFTQITTFTRLQRSELTDRLETVEGLTLPEPFREDVQLLKKRILNPSVVWWREVRK